MYDLMIQAYSITTLPCHWKPSCTPTARQRTRREDSSLNKSTRRTYHYWKKPKKTVGIDDVLVEQLKHVGPRAHIWLHSMLNLCFTGNCFLKVWRPTISIAMLKPWKDSAIPKNYRPISLLCPMYKLCERLILNSTISQTTPNQGANRFQTHEVMLQLTTHGGQSPNVWDNQCRITIPACRDYTTWHQK